MRGKVETSRLNMLGIGFGLNYEIIFTLLPKA